MKKIVFTLLFVSMAFAVAIAAPKRNGTNIKTDMPAAGTYSALGISSYVPCFISALKCYQNEDMYFSFSSDGSNPQLIPAGATYYEMDAQQDAEIYVTGSNNGDDACVTIYF